MLLVEEQEGFPLSSL